MHLFSPILFSLWILQYLCFFLLAILFILLVTFPIIIFFARIYFSRIKSKNGKTLNVGFFHPYCNAGGGGERVLWCAIQALFDKYPSLKISVYTGDVDASPKEIIRRAEERFSIVLPDCIEFVYLHKRSWVEANRYPYFTLLGQSIGSLILGVEALKYFVPDVFIDTMGYSFTLPLFSFIAKCKVASYIHYPTITSDMVRQVASRQVYHNNQRMISRNPFLTCLKLIYYKLFALVYKVVGKFSDVIMVNSSWTEDHINSLWGCPLITHRVYPPCDTVNLQKIQLKNNFGNKVKIISIAQFRPEKDHPLQLHSMYSLRQFVSESVWENIELVLIGSTRNKEDEARVKDMQDLCKHLALDKNVSFKVNISFHELKKELEEGLIGIHTMWNEHFGIGVVECMAAGLIMVAHKSGGPKMDIIEETCNSRNGFLASNETEYANAINIILNMSNELKCRIREAARSSVNRFSVEEFQNNFLRAVEPLIISVKKVC